jgi:hypothetical protein
MTELFCSYADSRDEAIVAFLYADSDPTGDSAAQRALFETHLQACPRCRAEVASLRGVRAQLARWAPPEPSFGLTNPPRHPQWWRSIPAWAQVAAALLFLGVSAGIANLDVRYDGNGLSLKTGWSPRAGGSDAARDAAPARNSSAAAAANAAPWKADIAALESQLKNELRAVQTASLAGPAAAGRTGSAAAPDAELTRRVRALVEESEKRQQRELALRIAELVRDVNAQRQADLVKIDRTLGVVQNNVGIEVMKTRQQMNQMDLTYRASQRQ